MVADFGCPFVKRDLIMHNPAEIPFTWRWAEIIRRHSDYDPALIERHLRANSARDLGGPNKLPNGMT